MMTAQKIQPLQTWNPSMSTQAWIQDVLPEGSWVRGEGGPMILAARAPSCLLRPEKGDRVLLLREGGEAWILAILDRDDVQATLELPENTRIQAGHLHLMPKEMSLTTPCARIRAADFSLESLRLKARSELVEIWIHSCRSFMDRLIQKFRMCIKHVEELEETQAKRITQKVSERYSLRAGEASLKARESMKLDGKKVHLG